MKLVFADFDQTISSFDTLLPFSHFLLQQEGRLCRYPLVFFFNALYRTGFLSDRSFRTRLCRLLVDGRTTRQVAEIAEQFHTQYSSTIINPVVWNWIKEQAGPTGRVVVLSTNFDFVIEPLRRHRSDLEIRTTQVEIQSGLYTNALAHHIGSSADKLRLFEAIIAAAPGAETVGLGDSGTDYGFLGRCQSAWIIRRPNNSRFKKCRRMINCCLGRFPRTPVSDEIEIRPFSR